MKRLRLIAYLGLLAIVAAACGTANAEGPPDINYGRDICVQCGMIINEAKFATAYEVADGEDLIFDDIGGMVLHFRDTGQDMEASAAWVHDYETEEWLVASEAVFVPTLSVTSPMGHSILAFASEERAQSFADDVGADVIDWGTLVTLPAVEGLIGGHHNEGEGDMDQHGGTDE